MIKYFEEVGVEMETSDMSFSVSLNSGKGCEWGSSSLGGLFAQKRNILNPYFYQMIREIVKFKDDVLRYLSICQATKHSPQLCSMSDWDYIFYIHLSWETKVAPFRFEISLMLLFLSGLHLSCMLADTAKTQMLGIWKIWKKEMVILKERLRLWGNL